MPADLYELEAYFNGQKRLAAIGVSIPPEMRVLEMVSAWPRLVVEALVERLTPEGFYFAEDVSVADEAWTWYLANRMDVNSILLHTESLAQGAAFGVVGQGDNGMPRYTTHTRAEFKVRYGASGQVVEALQRYKADDDTLWECHYEPGRNTYYGHINGVWRRASVLDSGVSRVPVVAFANRARIDGRAGESEMRDVMALADACSRSLTNLQVAQELVSMPQRYLMGADANSFVNAQGESKTPFEVYIGRVLLGPQGAQAGQFPGAQLDQIINTVKLYAQQVASVTGLPNAYLGINSDNPASAQAINAAANRHIKRAEQKQLIFGDAHEDMARIAYEMIHRVNAGDLLKLEMSWRNAATITLQEVGQAAIALTGGEAVIPPKVARELIGLSPEQRRIADEAEQSGLSAALKGALGV